MLLLRQKFYQTLGDIDYYAAKAQFSAIRDEFNMTNFRTMSDQDLVNLGMKESYLPYIRYCLINKLSLL